MATILWGALPPQGIIAGGGPNPPTFSACKATYTPDKTARARRCDVVQGWGLGQEVLYPTGRKINRFQFNLLSKHLMQNRLITDPFWEDINLFTIRILTISQSSLGDRFRDWSLPGAIQIPGPPLPPFKGRAFCGGRGQGWGFAQGIYPPSLGLWPRRRD